MGPPPVLLTTVTLQDAAARAGPQGNNNETHVGLPGKFHTGRLRLFFRNLEGLGMGLEQTGQEKEGIFQRPVVKHQQQEERLRCLGRCPPVSLCDSQVGPG